MNDHTPLLSSVELVSGYLPEVNILNGCNDYVDRGELVGIIGPNGAGKSTLIKTMFGLVPVRSGQVLDFLRAAGYEDVRVETVLSPAWSTDWMTEEGKAKLEAYGIAPPTGTGHRGTVTLGLSVKCPQCHSLRTRELARFGSTSCKALYRCLDCLEPFDYFKVLS